MEEKKFEFDERAPYAYFQNTACPYFPCHAKASREFFNCLFCYCPLYALGDKCGGNFGLHRKRRKGLFKLPCTPFQGRISVYNGKFPQNIGACEAQIRGDGNGYAL